MFALVFFALASLGILLFVVKWTLAPPNGPLDGIVRIALCSASGAMIAFWVVAASMAPELNKEARLNGTGVLVPGTNQARSLFDEVVVGAPIGMDIAAAVGAAAGFLIATASVGSYRRAR